jgi:tetratricopeptide (TPR) repeat protein
LFELAEAKNTDSITSVLVKAEEILLTEVKESPVYSKLLSLMGSKYSEIGNDDIAMTKFEEAIKLDEKDHAAISGSGMIHVKQQNIEVAVSCFRRSLALQPNCSQSLIGMGMVYRKIKLGSESIYWFKRAVDQLGSNSIATKHLVQTCLEFCTVPSSVEALESLLEEDSENDIIKKALIKVYDEQGRWKQSMNLSQPA